MAYRDGTKSLPPNQTEAARAFVRNIVDRDFNGNVSATAKKLDIAQSMLYDFLKGNKGPGMKMLGAISRYSNTPIDVIVGINTTGYPSRKESRAHASGASSVDSNTDYHPLEPISMDHPTSLRQGLLAVLAILRASHHLYWTAHWQAKGGNFFGDHLLFERLYKGRLEEIDQVSEISVSLFGPGAVDAITTWEAARLVIDEFYRVECLICNFITLEKSLQELISKVLPLARAEQPGGGVENLLTTLAQAHLQNEYLLQGRDRK